MVRERPGSATATARQIIEAKPLGAHLDDEKWARQILAYAMDAGVEWVALTDGNEWRIYNSHATVPVERKLFRVVRVAEPESRLAETLGLLSRAQLQDRLIDRYWKTEVVDRQLGDALRSLFSTEPDPAIVRLVHARVHDVSRSDVKASLGRVRATFDFPLVSAPAGRPRAREAPGVEVGTTPPGGEPTTLGAGTPWRGVQLRELIDAGLLRPPLDVEHRYRGTELTARIEGENQIVFGGVAYESLSLAGGMARKTIVGAPLGREYPQTNGWTFWEYRMPDGTRRPLDDLRRQLYEGKVVRLEAGRRTG